MRRRRRRGFVRRRRLSGLEETNQPLQIGVQREKNRLGTEILILDELLLGQCGRRTVAVELAGRRIMRLLFKRLHARGCVGAEKLGPIGPL